MHSAIKFICFADDDLDDHLIFTTALKESFPDISLKAFLYCDDLTNFLLDVGQPLPDVIFLDYNMPGNDGFQCLTKIKATARILHIPVIIYSTGYYEKTVQQSLAAGAFKYVVKPGTMEEVKKTISDVFKELAA